MKIFSLLLIVMISISSCGKNTNSNAEDAKKLTGEFHIVTLEKNSDLPNNLTINFHSETNKVSGFSGCNNFFGSFTLNQKQLSFGQMGSTRKMCFSEANKIETKTLELLSKINTFSFENNMLILKANEDILIKAKK